MLKKKKKKWTMVILVKVFSYLLNSIVTALAMSSASKWLGGKLRYCTTVTSESQEFNITTSFCHKTTTEVSESLSVHILLFNSV